MYMLYTPLPTTIFAWGQCPTLPSQKGRQCCPSGTLHLLQGNHFAVTQHVTMQVIPQPLQVRLTILPSL